MNIFIKKSVASEITNSLKSTKDKLEQLKNEVIAILKKKEDQDIKKAIEYLESTENHYTHLEKSLDGKWIEKAGYGVGTVRIWKGKKYKKVSASPTRWVRVFDKNDRGAATSMGRYIAQVKKCQSVEELYQFCMKQRSLFQDENGVDLPIMDKLKAAIDEQSGKIESGDKINSRMKEYQKEDLAKLKAGNYSFDSFADFKAEIKKQGNDFRGSKQPNYIGYLSQYNDNYLQQVYDSMPKADNRNESKADKYKKLQEEFKQEIADGKRNNTKELQEDVNEWKNLLAISNKDPNAYSKEQVEHFKEIIKIGQEELDKRNEKKNKEHTITTNMGYKTTESELKQMIARKEEELKEDEMVYKDMLKEKGESSKYTKNAKNNLETDKKDLQRWNKWLEAMKDGDIKESDFDADGKKNEPEKFWNGKVESEVGEGDFVAEMKGVGGGLYRNRFKTKAEAEKSTKNHQALGFESHVVEDKKDVSKMSKDEIISEMAKQVKLKNNRDENYYENLRNELNKINEIEYQAKIDAGNKININDFTLNKLGKKIDGEYPKFNKEQQKKLFSRIIEEFGESEKARKLIQNMQDFNSQKGEDLDINSYGDSWDYMKKQVGIEESEAEKQQNRSDAMKGNQNAYKGKPIEKAVEKYANDKKINSFVDKISDEDFAYNGDERHHMEGVYHEDGYNIATNGIMISMIKSDYPDSEEGKATISKKGLKGVEKKLNVLNKKLSETEDELKEAERKSGRGTNYYRTIENKLNDIKEDIAYAEKEKETGYVEFGKYGKYPAYKRVIPSMGDAKLEPADGYDDFDNILRISKVAAAYKKANDDNKTAVKVGDKWFNPDFLVNAVAMAKKHGLNEVLYNPDRKNGPIEFKGDNGSVVLMPLQESEYNTFDVQTGNYSSLNDDTQKQMDDFVNVTSEKKSELKKALLNVINLLDDEDEEDDDVLFDYDETDLLDEDYKDYDATQPELFNSIDCDCR